jgi:aminopeptidase N
MQYTRGTRILLLFISALLFVLANTAIATAEEAGVAHTLAVTRAARISDLHYRLSFTLKEHEAVVAGTETLTFESKTAGDLAIDYRDGTIHSATLNGNAIPIELVNGHLNLAAIAGKNTVTLAFTSNSGPAGKAITRYEDKDDGNEYFYTLFVPMDASMAFPCFDQPDLKGRFTLDLHHPAEWRSSATRHR